MVILIKRQQFAECWYYRFWKNFYFKSRYARFSPSEKL